jgi:hypothetical protein
MSVSSDEVKSDISWETGSSSESSLVVPFVVSSTKESPGLMCSYSPSIATKRIHVNFHPELQVKAD